MGSASYAPSCYMFPLNWRAPPRRSTSDLQNYLFSALLLVGQPRSWTCRLGINISWKSCVYIFLLMTLSPFPSYPNPSYNICTYPYHGVNSWSFSPLSAHLEVSAWQLRKLSLRHWKLARLVKAQNLPWMWCSRFEWQLEEKQVLSRWKYQGSQRWASTIISWISSTLILTRWHGISYYP